MAKSEWYKTSKYYVEPQEIYLNKELKESFQHISILKTLESLFRNEKFNNEYFKNDQSNPGCIDSFKKSLNFHNNMLFQECSDAVQIVLYLDDFQTGQLIYFVTY